MFTFLDTYHLPWLDFTASWARSKLKCQWGQQSDELIGHLVGGLPLASFGIHSSASTAKPGSVLSSLVALQNTSL